MKTFGEILEDTRTVFLDAALGAESVVYKKFAAEGIDAGDVARMAAIGVMTGRPGAAATLGVLERRRRYTDRAIAALVTRRPPDSVPGMDEAQGPQIQIAVANDSDDGIASAEVNVGRDQVQVAPEYGEAVQTYRITRILSQDPGMMVLEIGV